MKVSLVTPLFHQQRGNTITVRRISSGLKQNGIDTEIISLNEKNSTPPPQDTDVIHGFNAYRFYFYLKEHPNASSIPLVITLTGTDLNYDLFQPSRRQAVIDVLVHARIIHVFNEEAKATVIQEVPSVTEKVIVIPQGIFEFLTCEYTQEREEHSFVFLLPAGIRPVKRVPHAIQMLAKLHQSYPWVRLWLVGPILNEQEWEIVQNHLQEDRTWLRYLGEVPFEQMGSIYSSADVVINTSESEGQPAALLEALYHSVPVIASNISGNRSIIRHGKTGYLYHTEDEFLKYALQLIEDNALRKQMGVAGKAYVEANHSLEQEIKTFLHIYRKIFPET